MSPDVTKPRILVVEDEALVARDIGVQLVHLGYEQVGRARRGEEAILLCEELRPDLVVMDIRLAGGMDGIAAAQAIRTQFSLPVVFLTAFAEDETPGRAKGAEPFGYILKPFSEGELRTVLDMALYKHKAETRLRESEERYRTLIDWSPEPLAVYRDEKVIYVNPATAKMMGAVSAEDLVGKSILDFVHPDFHTAAKAREKSIAYGSGGAPRAEMRFLKVDGTAIDVEVHSTSILYDGALAVHTAMRDISERKRAEAARDSLEAQLRESQKMQAIGTLAGGIAHDFNNILAIILANAELARPDASHPRATESLDEIRKAGTRGRELVRQILSFSRQEPTERKRTDLEPIIEESVRLLRATLPPRIALDVRCEVGPAVLADATQIQQVLMNLATNAMHAMHDRPGRIAIRLDAVVIDAALVDSYPSLRAIHERHPGRALRLLVSDNGSGMDTDTLARIFEPFFTTKRVGEGTGLGLSVVLGIVEGHEGAVVVDSEPGRGSTFTVYLPAFEPPSPDSRPDVNVAATPALPVNASGRHILYLDDQQPLVFAMSRLLERRGYRVSGYTEPEEALEALRSRPFAFDLVVTDYNMPAMSGLEVAREIRAIRPDLPVALASGFLDGALREQAEEAGVRELIFKANTTADLCAAVQRLMSEGGGERKSS